MKASTRLPSACAEHIILRTAWVHSPFGTNFVRTMLRLAKERDEISVVNDQCGSPTYAPHLAEAIMSIAQQISAKPASVAWGVYHCANVGEASWYDVAVAAFQASREFRRAVCDGPRDPEFGLSGYGPTSDEFAAQFN